MYTSFKSVGNDAPKKKKKKYSLQQECNIMHKLATLSN